MNPDDARFDQFHDEYLEERDAELREWVERSLEELWESAGKQGPWRDATGEQERSDEGETAA